MNKEEAKDYLENYRKMYADLAPEKFLEALDCLLSEGKEEKPQGVDEAAEEASIKKFPDKMEFDDDRDAEIWYEQHVKYWRSGFKDGFKDGVKWDREQGVTIEGFITGCDDHISFDSEDYLPVGSPFEDMEKVLIQVRKKED